MTPDTILTLGGFDFSRFEVPETINFGGVQRMAIHKLVGGRRQIDALGFDPEPVQWQGMLVGDTALERGLYLKTLAESGQAVQLTWSELFYLVVVKEFHGNFQRYYQIPYQIVCEVQDDLTLPRIFIATPNLDDAMAEDIGAADSLVALINNSTLSAVFTNFKVAAGAISSFAKSAPSAMAAVTQPLSLVAAQVSSMIGTTDSALANSVSVGGVVPGAMPTVNAGNLLSQISSATQMPQLLQLRGVVGRMASNLGLVNESGRTLTVGAGDLMSIAAQQYGDPMGWTAIASANGLIDPKLTGIQTLKIPPFTNQTGGIVSG